MLCPVCEVRLGSFRGAAAHFSGEANRSDVGHVMWLNRNITKIKLEEGELEEELRSFFEFKDLKSWIIRRFVRRFYGDSPHPFLAAMQRPSRELLLGYVLEHQHFLRQWARSLAHVMASTEDDDVYRMELKNVSEEFVGYDGRLPHFELLIKMGESLGWDRGRILSTPPLRGTMDAIFTWRRIAETRSWIEIMAAMHCLELVAHKEIRKYGAKMTYFDPSILSDSKYPLEVREFLREGYEADVEHSEESLEVASKWAREKGVEEQTQVTVLKSLEAFDTYLTSRLERAYLLGEKIVG
ncbi:TenA family transcriptional regulator [Sulfodiicoccus acidiphilus]|uniref:TenA family transcriptional regulator n=1 Tax=Sulfodiicoccus acidiphilus TaxID=1670455 RepID=A0A348B6L2_9CREN|nr:C2H2 type zinc finger domain-containing protein [Sulfodiicoccus acidiphilus]BBD73814.1 TenA family transcriptional regulator [Sulfodiicoccus acidiphilus]GGT96548.1 TenA family transcriptional regulator [Sulfodiicoccus acidiphilus]